MANQARTVGSLETFEPEDKSFSKHILGTGTGDEKPNDGSMCSVTISVVSDHVISEEDLGAYALNSPCDVTVGEGDTYVTELFDKIILAMLENERCYVKTKINERGQKYSDFSVSDKGMRLNVILHSFSRMAAAKDMEADELLERAWHHKEKGSELLRNGNTVFSTKRCKKALKYLKTMPEESSLSVKMHEEKQSLQCSCILNLALIEMRSEQWKQAEHYCNKALAIEAENVKALFRRGCARLKLSEHDLAEDDFKSALKLEPDNKAVSNKLVEIKQIREKEKGMYKRMMNGKGK